ARSSSPVPRRSKTGRSQYYLRRNPTYLDFVIAGDQRPAAVWCRSAGDPVEAMAGNRALVNSDAAAHGGSNRAESWILISSHDCAHRAEHVEEVSADLDEAGGVSDRASRDHVSR